jgi:hypothetical protein
MQIYQALYMEATNGYVGGAEVGVASVVEGVHMLLRYNQQLKYKQYTQVMIYKVCAF